MLRHLAPTKIERYGEAHILAFLRLVSKPAEGGSRYGNVNGKRDLVLHLGDTADTLVAVVLEVKGHKNPKEMLAPDEQAAIAALVTQILATKAPDPAADTAAAAQIDALVAGLYGLTPAEAAVVAGQ